MNGFLNYTQLMSTNGAVSLMRTDIPTLPPFGVILADGELLDTFTDKEEACEFYDAAQHRLRAGFQWPDPDAPSVADVHPVAVTKWAMKKVRAEEAAALLPCGCYADACFCGQYPTQEEMSDMQAEADALLPDREPITDAEAIEAEELRNFFGGRHDN
jgi:hypothetical protein